MITSRKEFFTLLLEGKTLTKKDKEIDDVKYFLKYNNDNFVPYECNIIDYIEGTNFEWLSDCTIEESCEWLFNESMNYGKWGVLENE